MADDKIKICRWCHKIYDSSYCGNGCEHEEIFKTKKEGVEIEPRELILEKKKDTPIRWMCLSCKNEFSLEEIKENKYKCPKCGQVNDIYPFTSKACAICKIDGANRELPIWAKACEKCGKSDFIINSNTHVDSLKPTFPRNGENQSSKEWVGPPIFEVSPEIKKKKENTNVISLTFTCLSNNYEFILYAKSRKISVYEFIKDSNGYISDDVYEKMIDLLGRDGELFEIIFIKEKEMFSIKSAFPFTIQMLDARYSPQGDIISCDSNNECKLEENKLTRMVVPIENTNFSLIILLWVY